MSVLVGLVWSFLAVGITYDRVRYGRRRVDWAVAAIPCALLALDRLLGAA